MKKFLLYIIALLVPALVLAQTQQLFEIDANSFTPIQTDAISGVAIDKIGVDPSRRPCARIKMHINRMTKEDIAGISVRPVGGSVVVTKQIVATEGNGLIVEMTAKTPTRFYLHHDKYGDSNEISINLEGDKEYRLNAQLNLLQSVAISSNVAGGEVYIDNVFKGRTDNNFSLTVNDLQHGIHKLRIEYGGIKSEQEIVVSSTNILFRLNLKQEQARPQFVLFQIEPKDASVTIDGKSYVPDQHGYVQVVLNNGSYPYSISAKDYHSETGSFIVNGAKVEKIFVLRPAHGWLSISGSGALQGASVYVDGELIGTTPIKSQKLANGKHSVRIVKSLYNTFEGEVTISEGETTDYAPSLVADFANVTLNVGNNCDIYVNGERKGSDSWRGDLATGTYIIEARKEGYRTTSIAKNIEATLAKQEYNIPAPTPILGNLIITSSPAMADVYIDDKLVGHTPLSLDFIIGKHTIKVVKENLGIEPQSITISEGKTENLNFTLTEILSQSVIKYTTTNGEKVNPKETAFDAYLISNTYENGIGIIKFKKPIRKIGKDAFAYCSSLTSVTIPNSVTSIGNYAFYRCTSLKRIDISDLSAWCKISFGRYSANPLCYGAKLYLNGSELTNMTIPSDITEIKPYAFRDCTSLTSVTIPNSVTKIGEWAFRECTLLTSVTIPNSVTEIGEGAFCGCTSLTSVTIPNSVTKIGEWAFRECTLLTSVTIPNSITRIGYSAFRDCTSLTSVTIPDSVTKIGEWAFDGCKSLTSITIPNSVTSIGKYAFRDCTSLTSVTIPNSVTSIGGGAFYDCTSLTSLYCKATKPPMVRWGIFGNYASGRKIYVPRNSVAVYKSAEVWNAYADYIVGYDF